MFISKWLFLTNRYYQSRKISQHKCFYFLKLSESANPMPIMIYLQFNHKRLYGIFLPKGVYLGILENREEIRVIKLPTTRKNCRPREKKAKKEENCALKTEKLLVFPYFFPVFDKIKLIFYEKV